MSIYKGESDRPKKNIYSRVQSFPEIKQTSLLSGQELPERLIWSYAIETDLDGITTNIDFFWHG